MKTERNILLAFILNFAFSLFEWIGGSITGSVAVLSDAVHDLGDAASIGAAYFLEKKSRKQPDDQYTYGYARYSVLGGFLTSAILLIGSAAMICNAIGRIITPKPIHYDGMLIFAVVGLCVNLCAAFVSRKGDSLNQKAVNLHMLEDVLGWLIVLVGTVVMKFTDFALLDPLMSIGVSIFILIGALKNLSEIAAVFLEQVPCGIHIAEVRTYVSKIEGVQDVHHIHIWSLDGQNHCATMHVVTNENAVQIKQAIRAALQTFEIGHVTIETEIANELCSEPQCRAVYHDADISHTHHHHH